MADPEGVEDLREYVLTNVIRNGRSLGRGSYGSVEEVDVNGVKCAAKKLHDELVHPYNEDAQSIRKKFVEECSMMSKLKHPHIVEFLGVYYPNQQLESTSEIPWLVMEFLPTSLHGILNKGTIPLALKISLMFDVSKGLTHLHNQNPVIVHRDLTAHNVLVSSAMVAKIADLGAARIILDCFEQQENVVHMTRVPGNAVYMPPEAVYETSIPYNSKLDIFSYGVLLLFAIIQKFPCDLKPWTYTNPNNRQQLIPRTEIERRQDYFEMASHLSSDLDQALLKLTRMCLHNDLGQRPHAKYIMVALKDMNQQCPFDREMHVKDEEEIQQIQNEVYATQSKSSSSKDRQRTREIDPISSQPKVMDSSVGPKASLHRPPSECHRSKSEAHFQIKEASAIQSYKFSSKRMVYSRSEVDYKQFEFFKAQAAAMHKSASSKPTGWYVATLFTPRYISDRPWKAVFIVSRSDTFSGQPVQAFFERDFGPLFHSSQTFQFTPADCCVTLHIPHEEALEQGYKIKEDAFPCMFRKSEVDNIGMDFLSYPPRRILTVRPQQQQQQQQQHLDVELALTGVEGKERCWFQLQSLDAALHSGIPFNIGPLNEEEECLDDGFSSKQAEFLESEPDGAKFMNTVGCGIPPDKWKLYATQLGLSVREIDEIDFAGQRFTSSLSIMREVFKCWEKAITPKHTWNEVLKALESNSVNEPRLACEIRSQLFTDYAVS